MGLADGLGQHTVNPDILQIEGGKDRIADNRTDADHCCIHILHPKGLHDLSVRSIRNHCLTNPVLDFLLLRNQVRLILHNN